MRTLRFLSAALAALVLCAPAAVAQPAPPPVVTPDPPPIARRVSDLEREVLTLKVRLAALERAVPAVPVSAPSVPDDPVAWPGPVPGTTEPAYTLAAACAGAACDTVPSYSPRRGGGWYLGKRLGR